jgi:ribosomal protein L19
MNELEILWNECGHMTMTIPDTIMIKNKKIQDWLYTSSVINKQKGYIMKHKQSSISISKIFEVFSSTKDEIVAVMYTVEAKQNLNIEQFESILLSINDFTCPETFVIQKYMKFESEVRVLLKFPLEGVEAIDDIDDGLLEEVLGQSKRLMSFLCSIFGIFLSGSASWGFCSKKLYLTSLVTNRSRENRVVSAYLSNVSRNSSRATSRPLTALTEAKANSVRRASLFSLRSGHKKTSENWSQSEDTAQCDCCGLIATLVSDLETVSAQNQELEALIQAAKQEGKAQRLESESKWKSQCLEITKRMSDKMFEERNNYTEEIKKLKNCN